MPFRAKVKRAFGRDSPEEGSVTPKKEKKQKTPGNVYKPGEPMPRPKYRGPWDKEHQDKLQSFSFSFGRRKSDHSQYSPMGSKLPSRRGSFLSVGRKSFARSRQHSHVDPSLMEAAEGDDDVGNVGLSRQQTRDENARPRTGNSAKRPRTAESATMEPLKEVPTITQSNGAGMINGLSYGKPFTEDELTKAMSRSTLKPAVAGRA